MGYVTYFEGSFKFNHPPSEYMIKYINSFSTSRRVKRDVELIKKIDGDWEKHSFKGKLGNEGEYYVKYDNYSWEEGDITVIDEDENPSNQPSFWCNWIINEKGELCWNGHTKFYDYVEWLEYLINNFFQVENLVLNGEVKFEGEEDKDKGKIVIIDNFIEVIFDSD